MFEIIIILSIYQVINSLFNEDHDNYHIFLYICFPNFSFPCKLTQIVLKMDARSASNLRCLTSPAYTASVAKSGVITPKWRLWTPLWRHKIWSGVNPPKFKNVASFDDLIENVWFVASSAQIVAPFAQIMAIPNFLWKKCNTKNFELVKIVASLAKNVASF